RTGDPYEGLTVVATPSPDGVRTRIPAPDGSVVLGVPHVTMTVTRLDAGTDTGANIDARTDTGANLAADPCTQVYVFSKLIDDDGSGRQLVIDEQATPMCFSVRAGESEEKSFDLAAVAWRVVAGHKLFYEVSATSTDFAASREASTSTVSARVKVPVVARAAA
ncbi:MAG: hypothetical protein M3203_04615, partial [Actinomycetota bacterium]|nr:hypothetical protein [Actinomycetota bacterium]